jgi:hypothetical protein
MVCLRNVSVDTLHNGDTEDDDDDDDDDNNNNNTEIISPRYFGLVGVYIHYLFSIITLSTLTNP